MKKLELKDIAGYLSYGLLWLSGETETCAPTVHGKNFLRLKDIARTGDKPILRPISDLTREITHKGEKFVPIVELAKIAYDGGDWERAGFFNGVCQCDCNGVHFGFEPEDGSFIVISDDKPTFTPKQRMIFDLLNEWMFDYRDLIGQGLAIDVNTLKENCYE